MARDEGRMDPRPAPGDARRRQVHRGRVPDAFARLLRLRRRRERRPAAVPLRQKVLAKRPGRRVFSQHLRRRSSPSRRERQTGPQVAHRRVRTEGSGFQGIQTRRARGTRARPEKMILKADAISPRAPQRGRQRGGATGDAREWYMNFYGHVYETDEDDESETDEDDGTRRTRTRRRIWRRTVRPFVVVVVVGVARTPARPATRPLA